MLPDLDGFEVQRRLAADRLRVPIVFLTARGTTEAKVHGLTMGADDYVTKPFSLSRRTHGSWFRVTTAEVRRALEHPAPREAAAGAANSRSAVRAALTGTAPRRAPYPWTAEELAP